MRTRSKTYNSVYISNNKNKINKIKNSNLYCVDIDFDEASRAWHANKKSIGNGHYKYICTIEKNGIKCGKCCYKELTNCWVHRNTSKLQPLSSK